MASLWGTILQNDLTASFLIGFIDSLKIFCDKIIPPQNYSTPIQQQSTNEPFLITVIIFLSAVIIVASILLAVKYYNSWGVYR